MSEEQQDINQQTKEKLSEGLPADAVQPGKEDDTANRGDVSTSENENSAADAIVDFPQSNPGSHKPSTEQTKSSLSQTEQMEVHHHTHPGHHKKKWTDYFWEFLMLFLAVFCGFLAEYQLEHKIEKDRELQFVKSLLEDLKEDDKTVQQNIIANASRITLMDSLLTIITNPELLKVRGNDAYYMARLGPRILTLTPNNKTFEQLKNSGSFRLITRAATANRIMEYYNKLPVIANLEKIYLEEFAHYKTIAAKLFDPLVFRAMERTNGDISREANNPQLRTTDPELLKELGTYVVYMNGSTRSIAPLEEELLQNGKALITYLKKEYNID